MGWEDALTGSYGGQEYRDKYGTNERELGEPLTAEPWTPSP